MNRIEGKDICIDIPKRLRRLSNFERYLLWSAENNMAAVVRILGDIREDALRRAMDSVSAVHPFMGARVVFDGPHDIWFSTDEAKKATLRTVPRRSEEQWLEEVRQEYLVPFEPVRGPLIRFVLVYSRQVSEFIAFSQHSICDGISLANLLRDILSSYADPAVQRQAILPPATTDYLEQGDIFSSKSIDKAAIDLYNQQWQKNPYYFSEEDFTRIYVALARRIRHQAVILQLEPEETLDLVARCREMGATVTSALTAAFLAAYQEIRGELPENRRTIQVPFDLRRRLGAGHEDFLGFFVGAFKFPFAYDCKKTFWKNARDLKEIIRKRAEMLDTSAINMEPFDPTLVDAFTDIAPYVELLPEAFRQSEGLRAFARDRENVAFELCSKAVYNLPGTVSTNIGRLNFPEVYGDIRIDRMFFIAPASESFPMFIAGVSVNDHLAFSLNYVERVGGENALTGDMIRIRNRALEYLGFPDKTSDRAL
jgi:NRPS condensation-like uncharacterized protein